MSADLHWMARALEQARAAALAGEVPVGAVVVRAGQLIAAAHNQPIAQHDPTAHAEVLALRAAGQALGNYRLTGCTLYTTLEPCAMCAGAIAQARLDALVWGAADPAAGALGSRFDLSTLIQASVRSGVLAQDAIALLQTFFRAQRSAQRSAAIFLRDDALRTPAGHWRDCPDAPLLRHFCSDLPSAQRLRLSWLDNGWAAAQGTSMGLSLYLHGPSNWSWVWRPALLAHAARAEAALALDWLGFGHSDKPKHAHWHCAAWHAQVLFEWLERLPTRPTRWVTEPELAPWLRTLVAQQPQSVEWVVERPTALPLAIRQAPYPDRGHAVAPQAWARWPELGLTMQA